MKLHFLCVLQHLWFPTNTPSTCCCSGPLCQSLEPGVVQGSKSFPPVYWHQCYCNSIHMKPVKFSATNNNEVINSQALGGVSILILFFSRSPKCWQVLHLCRALCHVWSQLICKASWSYCKHCCWLRWLWALLSLTCFVSVHPFAPALPQCTSLLWRCSTRKAPRCASRPVASSPTWPWSLATGPASPWRGLPPSRCEVLTCQCVLTSGGIPVHTCANS